jgi:hypothetical protein
MLKKARLLTRPTLARRDAPIPCKAATLRLTLGSRFTVPLSDARTPLADFFSILLAAGLTARQPGPYSTRALYRPYLKKGPPAKL